MPAPRTIAVVTGTRAEFGLLTPILRAVRDHPHLTLRTVVTGMHLAARTWIDIRDAGFTLDARVPMQKAGQTGRAADVASLGRGVVGLGKAFVRLHPDVVLVLGDRVEAFAAAAAGSVGGFHVAHVHAGDRAQGVADEAMRHAISKLAHLHFAATAQSRRRLIRMGENADTVWNVGSPAIDDLADVKPAADAPGIIVMQHPVGGDDSQEDRWMRATLMATDKVLSRKRLTRLVMSPNDDPGSVGIRMAIQAAGVTPIDHLPRARFLALLAGARAIVGNSSAGLIEAAALKVPCVNIGSRQAGRDKPANVIDCDYGQAHVGAALDRALKLDLRHMRHPYGNGHTGEAIADLLANLNLAALPLHKRNTY